MVSGYAAVRKNGTGRCGSPHFTGSSKHRTSGFKFRSSYLKKDTGKWFSSFSSPSKKHRVNPRAAAKFAAALPARFLFFGLWFLYRFVTTTERIRLFQPHCAAACRSFSNKVHRIHLSWFWEPLLLNRFYCFFICRKKSSTAAINAITA